MGGVEKMIAIKGIEGFFKRTDEEGKMEEKKTPEEKMAEKFEKYITEADKLYIEGQYEESVSAASGAMIFSQSNNKEDKARAFDRRAWSYQKIGYKTSDKNLRANMYRMAREDWFEAFKLTQNFERRFSSIKGRMLVLLENVTLVKVEIEEETLTLNKELAGLYQFGEREIEKHASGQNAQNLKAELLNSLGIEVRKSDPETASKIFTCGYMIVEFYTTIAGHLQHNKGTCYLMLKNQTKDKAEKLKYAEIAILYLKWALEEYPEDQVAHRNAAENKIKNTEEEIKNNFE